MRSFTYVDREHCADCGKEAPQTETNYTLISAQFGWRLTRSKAPDGSVLAEWRCPSCWREFKKKQPGTLTMNGTENPRSTPPPRPARNASGSSPPKSMPPRARTSSSPPGAARTSSTPPGTTKRSSTPAGPRRRPT